MSSLRTLTLDPETNITFPKTMHIESKVRIPDMTLLGVGVRKVSFLKVKVYSIGFYADLSNPDLKIPEGVTPEEKIEYLVRNTTCCVRIIPYRNTNYHHLRDAFVRALSLRLNQAIRDKELDEDTGLNASANIRKVKTMFPNVSLNAGSALDVLLAPKVPGKPRVAIFRDLGTVEDEFTSVEFFMQYFRDKDAPPSPPLKERVVSALTSA
ncbi:chalcone isomerase [Schizophyllum fasciatum]